MFWRILLLLDRGLLLPGMTSLLELCDGTTNGGRGRPRVPFVSVAAGVTVATVDEDAEAKAFRCSESSPLFSGVFES